MAQTKRNPDWLIALIVAAVVLAALVHLAVANYFMTAKFEGVEAEDIRAAPLTVPHHHQARGKDSSLGQRAWNKVMPVRTLARTGQ